MAREEEISASDELDNILNGNFEFEETEDDNEEYESEEVQIVKQELYQEPGGYKEPDDVVEVVYFKAKTEHGDITGLVTARREGFKPHFEIENVEINYKNDKLEIVKFNPIIVEDED